MVQFRYVVPLAAFSTLTATFFVTRRFRPLSSRVALGLRVAAAAPLVASGALHLLHPQAFVSLLPPPLPQQSWLIIVTGVPELLGAAGLFFAPTRRAAGLCLALFMVAIFPANVYVAGRTVAGLAMPGVPVRAAMQAGYIVLLLVAGWGVPVRRSEAREPPTSGILR